MTNIRRRFSPSARSSRVLFEALDRRTLLSVAFQFNIIDPQNLYRELHPQLQRLLNAAGAEWASYMEVPEFDVTLEYNVEFSPEQPPATFGNNFFNFFPTQVLATGAAKSAQFIGVDDTARLGRLPTGKDILRLGTMTEVVTGTDPNGAKADGGIVIYAPNLKYFFFEPDVHARTATIPDGYVDGYSVLLHEIGHTLGFQSAADFSGAITGPSIYTYDLHIDNSFGLFFNTFGLGGQVFDPVTGGVIIDPNADNAVKLYRAPVPLQFGNINELGQGRPTDEFVDNLDIISDNLINGFFTGFGTSTFFFSDDLSTDLMAGLPDPGERKTISKLDLAIMKDIGLPVRLNIDEAPQGILTIDGTGMPDTINLSYNNGTLIVRVNDAASIYTPEQASGITALVINGLGGNDFISVPTDSPSLAITGGSGNDTIFGGLKGDNINGNDGDDLIAGSRGGDLLRGGGGRDTIYGQGGSDRILGDSGNDYVDGGIQTDRVFGGTGHDTVVGGMEDDFLFGQNGNDILAGAGGKDRMDGGAGADSFYGGSGLNDTVDYSTRVDLIGIQATIDGNADDGAPGEGDNIVEVENIIGTPFDDAIVGSDGNNLLIGGSGNDTIDGAGGDDTTVGDTGGDVLTGSGGNDSLLGFSGNDTLVGGTGRDILDGGNNDDQLFADDTEIDTLFGGEGNDSATADSEDVIDTVEAPTLLSLAAPRVSSIENLTTTMDRDDDLLRAAGLI